jgi:DNA-binding response OmpR family regulator
MSLKVNILLVEDDLNLGIILSDQLKSDGYAVSLCNNGVEAMQRFNEDKFHLCIFDVMLPRKDGFTLTRDIRKTNTAIPILFLSARGMTEDKVEGFNAGGDDYLSKPFSIEELQLRIKALLKRVNIKVDEKEQTNYALGIFVFDTENQTLVLKDQVKTLTKKEVQILKLLFKYKNQVVSREVILNAIWGQNDYFVGRSLDVFITKLRKYLREDPKILISNIHGVGFKFEILA